MREEIKARSWAWSGDHLKVYPVPTQEHYNTKGSTGRKISLPYVKLVIEIGNAKHEGKEIYKQNSNELKQKTDEIYLHYYRKRNDNRR